MPTKRTVWHAETGEPVTCWPVDARVLLASDEYVNHAPGEEPQEEPQPAPTPAAPEHPSGGPLKVSTKAEAGPAEPLKAPTRKKG